MWDFLPEFLRSFPDLSREAQRDIRKAIDGTFRDFTRENGQFIESLFDPLKWFLLWFQQVLLATPWWIIILAACAISYVASRSWKMTIGVAVAFLLIGWLGMWEDTMVTLAMVSVATLLCLGFGIPIGVLMARSDRM
ncbi:MAG: proline/glycine betaine ABC transporter permease, partial [Pseudomonadota bacterium]